ncbi:MAG: rhodanese-like domain-containing protein [Planctomycetota bacterium]|nr:rhodanese-like domain-containing protein [Planctomycetota bacterium]MEE3180316.1 rhodanese-like domain-containing protein [Planctomycetota bacterium]
MDIRRIDPEEARQLLDSQEGYTYLDVRSEEEFAQGHVPGAVNIPVASSNPLGPGLVANPDFNRQVAEQLDKDSKIITACLRGGRSLKAAMMLTAEGYTGIVDMLGGYDAELDAFGNVVVEGWARRGFPTTTEDVGGEETPDQ